MKTEETNKLINELFGLWESLAESGELKSSRKFGENYLEMKSQVKKYNDIHNVVRSQRLKEDQIKREQECGDHYYLPRGKWQSGMFCKDCGKTID